MDRPLCQKCNKKPAAINYRKGDRTFYRKQCASCLKGKPRETKKSKWQEAGYKKKPQCERCGFKARFNEQLVVWFVDKNMQNTAWNNMKTVCLNCQIEMTILGVGWTQGGLIPDR